MLSGGKEKLRETLGILAETWNEEIHKEQKLMPDILLLLKDLEFKLFHLNLGNWKRANY